MENKCKKYLLTNCECNECNPQKPSECSHSSIESNMAPTHCLDCGKLLDEPIDNQPKNNCHPIVNKPNWESRLEANFEPQYELNEIQVVLVQQVFREELEALYRDIMEKQKSVFCEWDGYYKGVGVKDINSIFSKRGVTKE